MITPHQKNVITTMLAQTVPAEYRFAALIIHTSESGVSETPVLDNCGTEVLQRPATGCGAS
jgi:hypothetical protein